MTEGPVASLGGLDVSRETAARLEAFVALVLKWTQRINLIAPATRDQIWTRHILDSAQLFPLAPHPFRRWADFGSGGGFPGLVAAILAADTVPEARFTLVESDQRKATFLRTASRELGLPVTVLAERGEATPPLDADIVSARALAPLKDLMPLVHRHLATDGTAIFPKGRAAQAEITALTAPGFDVHTVPSLTDPDAVIVTLRRSVRA